MPKKSPHKQTMLLKVQLQQFIYDVVMDVYPDCGLEVDDIKLEHPREESHGDYATAVAMVLSKNLRSSHHPMSAKAHIGGVTHADKDNPISIATKLKRAIDVHISASEANLTDHITKGIDQTRSISNPESEIPNPKRGIFDISGSVEKVLVAPPGFLNLFLNQHFLISQLTRVLQEGNSFGEGQVGDVQTVMVEFAHPNTHKQFHIGHLRNITIGESLVRVLEVTGQKVIRSNYQGDVGMHIAKALYGILKNSKFQKITKALTNFKKKPVQERVEFLGQVYAEGSVAYEEDKKAKEEIHTINKQIYETIRNPKKHPKIHALWKETRQWSLDYFESIYKRVGTHFDRLYFESEFESRGLELAKEALAKGVLKESDGAVVFDGTPYGLHTRVFINSLGLPTYEGKELGLAETQFREHGHIDKIIHVLGPEQISFTQVTFKVQELLGIQKDQQYHLAYGWVRLKKGKMSSRLGNVVTGSSLLDEAKRRIQKERDVSDTVAEQVALAAIKYSFLRVGVTSEIVFDLEESINFEGDSGPYLQYTYARARSVLRKGKTGEKPDKAPQQVRSSHLAKSVRDDKSALKSLANLSNSNYEPNPEELTVLRTLYRFPEVIAESASTYSSHVICGYLYTLAGVFNAFYNKHSILSKAKMETRNPKSEARNKSEIRNSKSNKLTTNYQPVDAGRSVDLQAGELRTTNFRLALTQAVAITLKNGLTILGIASPEKM